jgi:hypothetical protein
VFTTVEGLLSEKKLFGVGSILPEECVRDFHLTKGRSQKA